MDSKPDEKSVLLLDPENPTNTSVTDMYAGAPISTGLSAAEAARRLEHFGLNALEEKEENIYLKFLS